jgi:16S rRNA (uracil1498-N3)-methyltransferase
VTPSSDTEPLRHLPLVFVADLEAPVLDHADLHHLQRALRVDPGAVINVGDGAGRWRSARFGAEPEPVGPIMTSPAPAEAITIGFVPVKGTRAEWVVQKLTEIGVDRIVPLASARSVVRWDEDRRAKQQRRMEVAAREACVQCRRTHLPEIGHLTGLEPFVVEATASGSGVVLADPDGEAFRGSERVIVVGPEGGLSPDELALAPHVALPGHVLRAETAAISAAVVLCGLRGGQLTSPPR